MERESLGRNARYHTRLLRPPDIRAAQALFERAADYFEMATGIKPANDEATRAFVAGPPTKSVDDKRIIGVFDDRNELIGMLDALVDFPGDGDWTMGMLLLDPDHRGSGLGPMVLREYEEWAAENGAKRLHTALVSHHERGLQFLDAQGYERHREVGDYDAGGQTARVVFFSKNQ